MTPFLQRTLVVLACAGLLSVAAPAAHEVPATPALVPWADVAAEPCRHHGQELRLRLQVHSRPARWQPGPTRFGPGAFLALDAWSDEQFPWVEHDYLAPTARVFVRRDTAAARAIAAARTHQRLEIRGVVREVWRDVPWIEVTAAHVLDEEIGEATVIHAARAIDLMESDSWELADQELLQALSGPVPPAAREELVRLRSVCQEALRNPRPAPIRRKGTQD